MSQRSKREPDPFLWEVQAWTGSSVETLRYATHSFTTEPTDTPANTYYRGVIKDPGSIKRAIFEGNATSGRASVDIGFIELTNADGRLDPLFNYGWGRPATLKLLTARNSPVAGAATILKATVIGIETSDPRTVRLRVRSRLVELDRPLLTERYLGTTTSGDAVDVAEGDADLAGRIKPYVLGACLSVPGILVNKFQVLYQFAANPVSSIVVYDGGIALEYVADFPELSSLLNATIPPGAYATCVARGIARLQTPPVFVLSADVVEGASLSVRSAARVSQRMLDLVPTIDPVDIETATFDAFHAFNQAEVGILIDNDETAIDAISRVADSVGGAVLDTVQGTFQAVWNAGPSTTVDTTLTIRDLLDANSLQVSAGPSDEGQGVPAWSVVIKWGKVWRTQTGGDLAARIADATGGADLARKQLLASEFRQITAQDASVKTAHPLAAELTFETLLTQQVDAQAEAARRLALHKIRRDRIGFPTFFDRGDIELGRSVKVQMNRFGYNAGKDFIVLGRDDNNKRRVRTLALWG